MLYGLLPEVIGLTHPLSLRTAGYSPGPRVRPGVRRRSGVGPLLLFTSPTHAKLQTADAGLIGSGNRSACDVLG